MNGSSSNYDPFQMTSRFRDILARGDSAELQSFLQDIFTQYGAIPLAQAFIAPLAQSLASPLSQYLSSFMNKPGYTGTASTQPDMPNEVKKAGSINSMLFEIHGFVVIRANIPEDVDIKDIKVYFSPGYITIKGDSSGVDHIIQLPPGAIQEGATAAFKDRVLEVRIPKESTVKPENEVGVEYL
jgi:HSP20 family molecular chaperone IbpA